LSDRPPKTDPPSEQAPASGDGALVSALTRLMRLFGALRAWAYGHWIRGVIVAGIILSLIALTMAGWAYLASVALRTGEMSIDSALQALDDGRHDEARTAVARMLKSGLLPRSEYGGPLFVLGAVKIKDAENEPSAERRRIEYLVASRYLEEARAYGLPKERACDGTFMLAKSLVESGQFDEGLQVLDELLADPATTDNRMILEVQWFVADTCLLMPNPNVDKALQHNKSLLANAELTEEQRATALAQQAECLLRLARYDEARQSLAAIPTGAAPIAAIKVLRGRILLDELDATLQETATAERKSVLHDSAAKVSESTRLLREAARLDAQNTHITREASYHAGRAHELKGDESAALKQYARTRQLYGESFEGLAAALAEADLLRQQGDFDGALLGYRRVLESFKSVPVYRSAVLPLAKVREHMTAALKDFIDRRRFYEALALLDHFQPMFSRTEQLELRGGTLERWGNMLLIQASDASAEPNSQLSEGLQKLRAAGLAFEQLAELRFATRSYTTDLWHSAEDYFAGHSFTSTIRLLNKYLANEPELRNAQALLRLGQAHLAIREFQQSIAAFEECIEFHPLDSSTFQARIDCAKAYWHQGDTGRAEQLLRENIAGSSLKPSSREWTDSLFELGMLLHETGQYEQAIITLEEAIERYPRDSQRLIAQYVLGESYRQWAQKHLGQAQQSRTAGERDKNIKLANDRLTTALKQFEDVQVSITLRTHDLHSDPLLGAMLRNCYMLEGTVLFDLGRYKDAIEAYSNVASLYPDHPFVLETFVQIANCWRRLGQEVKARGAIQQAQIVLNGLPPQADFASATALNREEWGILLADMSKW
jgi:tetratricopeptide (TPR) repeat protein